MATIMVHPETRIQPAELIDGNPINCAACNNSWDEDEDLGSTVELFDDGEYYCKGDCLKVAREKYYRTTVAELVYDATKAMLREIAKLDKHLGNPCDADPAHPAYILDDLLERTKLFGEGKDSGWRNGLMLDEDEARKLRYVIRDAISHIHTSVVVRNALTDKCAVKGWEWQAKNDGETLAKLGNSLLAFDDQSSRTNAA